MYYITIFAGAVQLVSWLFALVDRLEGRRRHGGD